MYDRVLKLINEDDFQRIQQAHILLIGIGGVGGYAFECLIRSGFLHITVIDPDIFDLSNFNRQILATKHTLGVSKSLSAKKRAQEISSEIEIESIEKRLTKEDITAEFLEPYDFILDACDSVEVKIALLEKCALFHKNLISSMGTANRFHPELLDIMPLGKTKIDPLAKKIRNALKNNSSCLRIPVLCSKEYPKKQSALGTITPVPMAAGALLASYVILKITKEGIHEKK